MEQVQSPTPSNGPAPYSTERARATFAVCVAFMILATIAVIARFWSRRVKGMKPALDDWLIVAGLIFYYTSAIQTILQVTMGRLGHHLTDGVTVDQLTVNGKLGTYGQYSYALAMGFIRWCICALFGRIFVTENFRRAILACNIVNVLWIIFSIVIVSVRCIPFRKNWDPTQPGTCLAQVPIVAAVAAWGLAIELTLWTLPIPASWTLQMPRSNKIALTCIFGLGIFDIGVGIGRVVTILQVQPADFTWTEAPALQWLAIEPSIAIVVSCMCVCRPLLDRYLPQRWRLASGSARSGDDHAQLVGAKPHVVQYDTEIRAGSDLDSTLVSQTELEERPPAKGGGIQVRRDVVVDETLAGT